jgi:hypothetical protein
MIDNHVHPMVEELHARNLPAVIGPTPLAAAIPLVVVQPGTSTAASPSLVLATPTNIASPFIASADFSAQLTANSIASRSAISAAHQVGVENDLSPLAEAPEGIAIWESPDSLSFARPR